LRHGDLLTGLDSYSKFKHLDPRTKIIFLFIANFIVLAGRDILSLSIFIVMAVLLLLSEKIKYFIAILVITFLWWFFISYFLGSLTGEIVDPFRLFIGLVIKGTTIGSITVWFMFSATTYEIFNAMDRMKFPVSITLPFLVTVRFIPTMANEFITIRDALKLRGIYRSVFDVFKRPVMLFNCFIVPMIIRSMKMSEEIAIAAETRGIGASVRKTRYYETGFCKYDFYFFFFWVIYLLLTFLTGVIYA
jgi:energy-coupling factor transport system permease protein